MGVTSAAHLPSAPHSQTESGRKSNLKRKHTQTHTNKCRDSNNHKPRYLSHNFPKENKTDQQTRMAKLSVMMLRLVWVSFHYVLIFSFFFPGLEMNADGRRFVGRAGGGLSFSVVGLVLCFIFVLFGSFAFFLSFFFPPFCFVLSIFVLILVFSPRTRFFARLWRWVLSVPGERCERGRGPDRDRRPQPGGAAGHPEARERSLSSLLLPQ